MLAKQQIKTCLNSYTSDHSIGLINVHIFYFFFFLLKRPLSIVGDAGLKPGTFFPEVLCANIEPPHQEIKNGSLPFPYSYTVDP